MGAVIALALPWDVLWRYFSWANQTLAMIVLWTGAVFLHKFGYPPKACFIAALPATFMSGVSVTYFFQAPECLACPPPSLSGGIVAAALVVALVVALVATPVVKNLVIRVKAVDVPKDGRRMHDHPIPHGRTGHLPGFLLSVLLFWT